MEEEKIYEFIKGYLKENNNDKDGCVEKLKEQFELNDKTAYEMIDKALEVPIKKTYILKNFTARSGILSLILGKKEMTTFRIIYENNAETIKDVPKNSKEYIEFSKYL